MRPRPEAAVIVDRYPPECAGFCPQRCHPAGFRLSDRSEPGASTRPNSSPMFVSPATLAPFGTLRPAVEGGMAWPETHDNLTNMESWRRADVPVLPGSGPAPRLHDTATGELVLAAAGPVATRYACGITPYDATHIGHAATYTAWDLLVRAWLDADPPTPE